MNFFETVINFFNLIWDYFLNTFTMLNTAIMLVYTSLNGMTTVISFMPSLIGAGCMICFTFLVVRFLLLK